ncbi:MAG: biopolymer transporter ExbD [Myxococcota bacterium]
MKSPFKKMRAKRRDMPGTELALAAMVDMMINLLIFLLHLYGRNPLQSQPKDALELASSRSQDPIAVAVSVVVSLTAVSVRGETIVPLESRDGVPAYADGAVVDRALPELADRLRTALADAQENAAGEEVEPEVVVESDRRIPWSVLEPVVASAGDAGIARIRFVVRSRSKD